MASVLVEKFTESKDRFAPAPDTEHVEEMLLQVTEDKPNTVLEDGSEEEVATDIMKLWANVNSGNSVEKDEVTEWESQTEKFWGQKIRAHHEPNDNEWENNGFNSDASGGGDVPMLVDRADNYARLQNPEFIIDEDGFTLVQGKVEGRSLR